jgi:hypothetical protein
MGDLLFGFPSKTEVQTIDDLDSSFFHAYSFLIHLKLMECHNL